MLEAKIIKLNFEIDDVVKLNILGEELLAFCNYGIPNEIKENAIKNVEITVDIFNEIEVEKLEQQTKGLTQISNSLAYVAFGLYNPNNQTLDVGFNIDLSEYDIDVNNEQYIQIRIDRFNISF